MQMVKLYYSMSEARAGMEQQIYSGWRIHSSIASNNKVLVVYEKE